MRGLILRLPLLAPAAIGWDIGAALDNVTYQLVIMLATMMWAPHAVEFALARYLQGIAFYLSTGILPAAMGVVQSVIVSTGLAAALTTIALMLVGVGYLISPYLPEFRLASLSRVVIFSVAMVTLLSQGPEVAGQLELARLGLASSIADSAFQQLMGDPGFRAASGSLAHSPESGMTNTVTPRDYDGLTGMSAYDVAASAIPVCPFSVAWAPPEPCAQGAELSVSLPLAFKGVYMPHDALTDGMSGDERTQAKEGAWRGVSRLAMTYPVTLVALLDAIATVLFSAAAGFILLTLPLALLFAVFLPLENMATSLLKMYLNLFLYTGVIAVLTSIGVAAQLAALETHAIAPLVGASAIALMMEFIAIKAGLTALSQSVFAFGDSLTANLGMSGGGPQSMVGTAAQVALGAATGGASLAVGLAAGSAGMGLLAAGSRQEGTARGGALSMAGGALVGRSPLRGAGLALGMMAMGRGEDGGDTSLGQALAGSSTVEAGLMGMSAGSGSPLGMMLAMTRMRQQRGAGAGKRPPPVYTGLCHQQRRHPSRVQQRRPRKPGSKRRAMLPVYTGLRHRQTGRVQRHRRSR